MIQLSKKLRKSQWFLHWTQTQGSVWNCQAILNYITRLIFLGLISILLCVFFNFLVHGRDGWIRFLSGLPKNHGHSFTTFFYACLHSFWSQPCFHTSYQKLLKSKKRRVHEEDLQGNIQRAIESQKKLKSFI